MWTTYVHQRPGRSVYKMLPVQLVDEQAAEFALQVAAAAAAPAHADVTSHLASIEADVAKHAALLASSSKGVKALEQKAAASRAAAEAKRSEADACKDKGAKAQLIEDADAAEAEAAEHEAESLAAQSACTELVEKHDAAKAAMRLLHVQLTSQLIIDEGRAETSAFRAVFAETDAGLSQVLADDVRFGQQTRRFERQAQRAEEKADLIALRDMVDPDFYKDEYVAFNFHTRPGKDLLAGSCPPFFGDPAPPPSFQRPEHTAPLPADQRLHRIAAFSPEDRVTLDHGTARAASVAIHQVQLGDKAMPPGPLRGAKPHEAVGRLPPA
jgi:hypothetical protein